MSIRHIELGDEQHDMLACVDSEQDTVWLWIAERHAKVSGNITPAAAREFGAALIDAADEAERIAKEKA